MFLLLCQVVLCFFVIMSVYDSTWHISHPDRGSAGLFQETLIIYCSPPPDLVLVLAPIQVIPAASFSFQCAVVHVHSFSLLLCCFLSLIVGVLKFISAIYLIFNVYIPIRICFS